MGTVIKRILMVIMALVILLTIAFGIITALFNPNDYKDDIESIALDKAGIELDINGDISWSVFPDNRAVRLKDKAALSNVPKSGWS